MLENDAFIKTLLDFLKANEITQIFCSTKFSNCLGWEEFTINKIEDVRSMVYVACGACAIIKKPVVVMANGDNESRSLFSGMTEAFHRDLPIIAIIFSNHGELNYKKCINDCAVDCINISDTDSSTLLTKLFDSIKKSVLFRSKPILINYISDKKELNSEKTPIQTQQNSNIWSTFDGLINDDDYLFIAQDIKNVASNHKYKTNNGAFSNDGIISTVFGAALSGIHKNYYCVLSYKDFIHDINSLANRHFPNNCIICVLSNQQHKMIADYCNSLGIDYRFVDNLDASSKSIKDEKKSLVIEIKVN